MQISNDDTVILEIIHENLKLLAASLFFDIEDQIENYFTKIFASLHFDKGGKIVIHTDSNCRSRTWHDIITN